MVPKKERKTRHATNRSATSNISNRRCPRKKNWTSSVVARRSRADDISRNKTGTRTRSRNGENFEVGCNGRVYWQDGRQQTRDLASDIAFLSRADASAPRWVIIALSMMRSFNIIQWQRQAAVFRKFYDSHAWSLAVVGNNDASQCPDVPALRHTTDDIDKAQDCKEDIESSGTCSDSDDETRQAQMVLVTSRQMREQEEIAAKEYQRDTMQGKMLHAAKVRLLRGRRQMLAHSSFLRRVFFRGKVVWIFLLRSFLLKDSTGILAPLSFQRDPAQPK